MGTPLVHPHADVPIQLRIREVRDHARCIRGDALTRRGLIERRQQRNHVLLRVQARAIRCA